MYSYIFADMIKPSGTNVTYKNHTSWRKKKKVDSHPTALHLTSTTFPAYWFTPAKNLIQSH